MTDLKRLVKNLCYAAIAALIAIPAVAQAQTVSIGVSPNNFTMNVGDQRTVNVTSTNPAFIGSNSNISVASVVLSGSFITVTGISAGTDNVSICSYDANNNPSCAALTFSVIKPSTATQTQTGQTTQTTTISFSQSQLTLDVGQSQNVTVSGSGAGSYYVSSISNPSVATASVPSGSNSVSIAAANVGGTNISVCQFGGTCANVYVYVPPTSGNVQAAAQQSVVHSNPRLAAFYAASNDIGGGFLGAGAAITLKFNTSADVASESLSVDGQSVPLTGSGSGPFAGTYTMTGSERLPLAVSIDFTASDGTAGHADVTVNDPANAGPAASPNSGATLSAGGTAYVFSRALQSGSSGPDVVALQRILTKLGDFNGPVTGNFGPLTQAAVKRYQAANGLPQAGVVGPATRRLLDREAF